MMRATEQYHEFDNLGGKQNETNNILIDLRFDFYWHRPERFPVMADDRRSDNVAVSLACGPNESHPRRTTG
jgi:hypothetical protein